MSSLNAFEMIGSVMTLYWNEWKEGDILEFEFVDFFKGPVITEGAGKWQIFYAIALKDYDHLGIKKGDEILLHLAYKSFIKALTKLPAEIKVPFLKKHADGKNLYITLERVNPRVIKVHYAEPREPTKEQLANSKKYYEIVEAENKHNEGRWEKKKV